MRLPLRRKRWATLLERLIGTIQFVDQQDVEVA
jgi:hypothetical protein